MTSLYSATVGTVSRHLTESYESRRVLDDGGYSERASLSDDLDVSALEGQLRRHSPECRDAAERFAFLGDDEVSERCAIAVEVAEALATGFGVPLYDGTPGGYGLVVSAVAVKPKGGDVPMDVLLGPAPLPAYRFWCDAWFVSPPAWGTTRHLLIDAFIERVIGGAAGGGARCVLCGDVSGTRFLCRRSACQRRAPRYVRWTEVRRDVNRVESVYSVVVGDATVRVRPALVSSVEDIFALSGPHERTAVIGSPGGGPPRVVGTLLAAFCSEVGLYMASPGGDVLCAWDRSRPFRGLWVPGTAAGDRHWSLAAVPSGAFRWLRRLAAPARALGLDRVLGYEDPPTPVTLDLFCESSIYDDRLSLFCESISRESVHDGEYLATVEVAPEDEYQKTWGVTLRTGVDASGASGEAGSGAAGEAGHTVSGAADAAADAAGEAGHTVSGAADAAADAAVRDYDFDPRVKGLVDGYTWSVWDARSPPKPSILMKQLKQVPRCLPGSVVSTPEGDVAFRLVLEPDTCILHLLFSGTIYDTDAEILVTLAQYSDLTTNPRIYPRTETGIWATGSMACMGNDSSFHNADAVEPAYLHNIVTRIILRFSPFMEGDLRGSVGYLPDAFGDSTKQALSSTREFNRTHLGRTMALFGPDS